MIRRISGCLSLVLQGVFSLACILEVILCMIYRNNYKTDFGRSCAYIALDLTGYILLFLVIALPLSFVLNVIALYHNEQLQKKCCFWKLWIVISLVLFVLFWIISVVVFVNSTGGV